MNNSIELADPVFTSDFILNIVRRHAPDAKEVTCVDEQGGSARAYHIDNRITLKVQRPHRVKSEFNIQREVFLLKELEKQGVANVPRTLGYGKQGAFEYNCMTKIPGLAVRFTELTPEQRANMLQELGKTLYQIHNIPLQPFYDSSLAWEKYNNADDIQKRVWHYFGIAINKMSRKPTQEQIDDAKAQAGKLICKITGVSVKIRHADPSDEHTFVKDGNYTGLIDFGDAYITHPAFDLRRWPEADRPALMKGYLGAGKVEDSFLPVCEAIFAVEDILSELKNENK